MKFIFTKEDKFCEDEYQGGTWLSEETGWWYSSGDIWIWTPGQTKLRQVGVAVHEASEYIMIHRLGMKGNGSHWLANCLEFLVTIGTADLSWGRQDWKNEKNVSE